VTCER